MWTCLSFAIETLNDTNLKILSLVMLEPQAKPNKLTNNKHEALNPGQYRGRDEQAWRTQLGPGTARMLVGYMDPKQNTSNQHTWASGKAIRCTLPYFSG